MRRRPDASEVRKRPFGELVTRLIAGYSTRDVWAMTGVSHTTIGNMAWGVVPSYRILAQFADGLEKSEIGLSREDRISLYAAAGYAPEWRSPSLDELLDETQAELSLEDDRAKGATPEQIEAITEAIRRKAREKGMLEDP